MDDPPCCGGARARAPGRAPARGAAWADPVSLAVAVLGLSLLVGLLNPVLTPPIFRILKHLFYLSIGVLLLVDARAAILEERFEDAANSLAAARALGISDDVEIATIEAELDAARNSQQASEVLALANARLEEGDLLTPANDNARYYYELVLTNDPGNTAARQGLTVVANTLVLQARNQIDSGNFAQAQNLLDDIRAIDPQNSELISAEAALVNARDALAERQRQAEAERLREIERQAEAERIAEAERQAAEARAAAERAAAEQAAAEAAAAAAAAQEPVDNTSTDTASVAGGAVAASATSNDAATQGPGTSTPTSSGPAVTNASGQAAPPADSGPVAISSLERIKYVARSIRVLRSGVTCPAGST